VGGDLYAVFPIEKDRTTLVVADVSGKGLAAASQVATLRDMLRFALHQRHTLAESVTDLNRILAQNHLLAGFATLFVGTYDSGARTLTYVSCGQEPGLVWRAATGTVEELPPTGAVLGAFEEAAFEEASVPLAPGDVLAVFTDGLTEIGPDRSRLLGIQGVAALLKEHTPAHGSAADIVSDLVAAAEAYGRGGVRDDIALLVGVVGGGSGGAEDKVYGR
jgi:serine phosphatase RsbU (regulator of sigma subunit)